MTKDFKHLIYYRFNMGPSERDLAVVSRLLVGVSGCFSCMESCLFSSDGKYSLKQSPKVV
jgi:hypothetical protein